MDPERRRTNKRLAYVRQLENGYRGYYLDKGRYRGGPIFETQKHAHAWTLRKREEIERRSSAASAEPPQDARPQEARPRGTVPKSTAPAPRKLDPRRADEFDPTDGRRVRAFQALPLYDEGSAAEDAPRPGAIRRFSDLRTPLVEPAGTPTETSPQETPEEPVEAALPKAPPHTRESLLLLDGFVHDSVGTLHGDENAAPAPAVPDDHVERFLRLLDSTPSSKGQVLGSPVFFGASPDIGLESALSLLGSLRKTGVLQIQAADTRFTVSIVDGDVVHGVSDPRPDSELLGNLLLARGAIDADRLDRFFADHGSSPASLGEALDRQALVSPIQLQSALEQQLRLLFDRLLATRDAVWCFHEGEATLAYIHTRLNVMGVILESARKSDEERAA